MYGSPEPFMWLTEQGLIFPRAQVVSRSARLSLPQGHPWQAPPLQVLPPQTPLGRWVDFPFG